jgi:hypothetical protein
MKTDRFLVNSPLLGYTTTEEAVFSVSTVTAQQWIVITWYVFTIGPCPFLSYISKAVSSDHASHRRWQKEKSQIWDSKIWLRVLRDSDTRKTALARANSTYKRQTGPLVRDDTPQKQDCNCQTVLNIWSWAPDGARHQGLLTDWLSVAMWLGLMNNRGRSMWTRRQTSEVCSWRTRLYLCIIFGVCDSVRLLQLPCYKPVKITADRLKRSVWSDGTLCKAAIGL